MVHWGHTQPRTAGPLQPQGVSGHVIHQKAQEIKHRPNKPLFVFFTEQAKTWPEDLEVGRKIEQKGKSPKIYTHFVAGKMERRI